MALSQSVIPELETRCGLGPLSLPSEATVLPLSLPRFILEAERAPGSLWTPESSPSGTGSRRQVYFMMNGTCMARCMQSTYPFDLEEAGR